MSTECAQRTLSILGLTETDIVERAYSNPWGYVQYPSQKTCLQESGV